MTADEAWGSLHCKSHKPHTTQVQYSLNSTHTDLTIPQSISDHPGVCTHGTSGSLVLMPFRIGENSKVNVWNRCHEDSPSPPIKLRSGRHVFEKCPSQERTPPSLLHTPAHLSHDTPHRSTHEASPSHPQRPNRHNETSSSSLAIAVALPTAHPQVDFHRSLAAADNLAPIA